jgi:hypothetical protein
MPILGIDGAAGQITVDPDAQKSFQRLPNGGGVVVNPNLGHYAVRVVVGASYSTQRSQTNAAFAEIMRGNKELAQIVAPFWAQTLDFPGSDKFAQAMAAMAPPPVKAILQPEGSEDELDPAALAQQLAQCKQALEEAIQHAHDAQGEADQAMRAADVEKTKAMARDKELEIAEYEAETKRLQVTGANEAQIQAITAELVREMLDDREASAAANAMGMPTPGAEMAGEQPEAPEAGEQPEAPEQPSQEMQALIAGQQQIAQAMQMLAQATMAPRKRVPVRDQAGNIVHVIDQPDAIQ